ncbi:aspartic proteinase CDR1-like [Malania oleifera]|uniref:aspartic proteinase CDR1-like n=1 Tax=Malania oleifera TaxID=397392 RepID=UPI0025AE7865|nr:aspartic proteinase CDR1-like [Malania oleifera]
MAPVATASYRSFSSAALSITVVVLIMGFGTAFSQADNNNNDNGGDGGGFSVNLIPRNSPGSPFYKPSETHFARLRNAFRRSINRANHFIAGISPNAVDGGLSQVIPDNGEYLLNISVGTPRTEILAIADTGSDLIWTQCAPCAKCYRQKAPLFNPKKSSTYTTIPCASKACTSLDATKCSAGRDSTRCQYVVQYGDGSYSVGILSADAISLGTSGRRPISLRRTIFGCGYRDGGTFGEDGSGIVGLGGGPYSAVSQMKSLIRGKFSYCLLPLGTDGSSKMNFGAQAAVSGARAVSTPLASKYPSTYYYLTLEAISVQSKRLDFVSSSYSFGSSKATDAGNIIIDSGTTLTLLPKEFYSQLESAVAAEVSGTRVRDPEGQLSLCYRSKKDINAPVITAHFTGADVRLKPLNTFVRIANDIVCLAFVPTANIAIFGNLAQMNLLVGYDLNARTVTFKPADCSRL